MIYAPREYIALLVKNEPRNCILYFYDAAGRLCYNTLDKRTVDQPSGSDSLFKLKETCRNQGLVLLVDAKEINKQLMIWELLK